MSSSYLLINGLRVHYLHWNFDSNGRPLVLLHGLNQNARFWERAAPSLAESGLRVLAPDSRGHGFSDDPNDGFSLESMVGDLVAFVTALDVERPVLMGQSWGASAALEYAARIPVGPRAPSALVLVDGGVQRWQGRLTWEQMQARIGPQQVGDLSPEDYIQTLTAAGQKWQPDDEAVQIMLSRYDVSEDEKLTARVPFENQAAIMHSLWENDPYLRFSKLRCPVLVVAARFAEPYSDGEAAAMAAKEEGIARLQAELPAAQVTWLPDTIHNLHLQRPQELSQRVIEFLREIKP